MCPYLDASLGAGRGVHVEAEVVVLVPARERAEALGHRLLERRAAEQAVARRLLLL